MAERKKFHWVLCQAFLVISLAYICFGIFGYFAYGDETKEIITLNLPNNWSSIAVKVSAKFLPLLSLNILLCMCITKYFGLDVMVQMHFKTNKRKSI